MIAVFARPDHPEGYGMQGDKGLRAHGYVVVLVRVKSESQLASVTEKLVTAGLPEPFGHPDQWYGGRLDLIALLPGNRILEAKHLWLRLNPRQSKVSIGDNRFAGFYDADEIL